MPKKKTKKRKPSSAAKRALAMRYAMVESPFIAFPVKTAGNVSKKLGPATGAGKTGRAKIQSSFDAAIKADRKRRGR